MECNALACSLASQRGPPGWTEPTWPGLEGAARRLAAQGMGAQPPHTWLLPGRMQIILCTSAEPWRWGRGSSISLTWQMTRQRWPGGLALLRLCWGHHRVGTETHVIRSLLHYLENSLLTYLATLFKWKFSGICNERLVYWSPLCPSPRFISYQHSAIRLPIPPIFYFYWNTLKQIPDIVSYHP